MNNNKANIMVQCPNCGTNINLTISAEEVKNGVKKHTNKATERIAALKAAGVDVTNLFAMTNASGEDAVVKMSDGAVTILNDNDPIFLSIKESGMVYNPHFFRRWVMAQMFRHLDTGNYVKSVRDLGYDYTWKQALEEYRAQAKMLKNGDRENYEMRNKWFSGDVAVAMCIDYVKQLEATIAHTKVRYCKRRPYYKLSNRMIFCDEVESKLIKPLNDIIDELHIVKGAPEACYHYLKEFTKIMIHFKRFTQSKAWIEAYKGSGAYFTLRNLFYFHGACMEGCAAGEESVKALDEKCAEIGSIEGYKVLGLLREVISRNDIDIKAKRAEWREAKKNH